MAEPVWFPAWSLNLGGGGSADVSEASLAAISALVAHRAAPERELMTDVVVSFPGLRGRKLHRAYECTRALAVVTAGEIENASYVAWQSLAHEFVGAAVHTADHSGDVICSDFPPAVFAGLSHARDLMLLAAAGGAGRAGGGVGGGGSASGMAGVAGGGHALARARRLCESFLGTRDEARAALVDMANMIRQGPMFWADRALALVSELLSILIFVSHAAAAAAPSPGGGGGGGWTTVELLVDAYEHFEHGVLLSSVDSLIAKLAPCAGTLALAAGILGVLAREIWRENDGGGAGGGGGRALTAGDVQEDMLTIAGGAARELHLTRAVRVLCTSTVDLLKARLLHEVLVHIVSAYLEAVTCAGARSGSWMNVDAIATGWLGLVARARVPVRDNDEPTELLALLAVMSFLLQDAEGAAPGDAAAPAGVVAEVATGAGGGGGGSGGREHGVIAVDSGAAGGGGDGGGAGADAMDVQFMGPAVPSQSSQSWACPACTFLNAEAYAACDMCGADAPAPARRGAPGGDWVCGLCTFENPSGVDKCGMCETAYVPPPPAPAAAAASPQPPRACPPPPPARSAAAAAPRAVVAYARVPLPFGRAEALCAAVAARVKEFEAAAAPALAAEAHAAPMAAAPAPRGVVTVAASPAAAAAAAVRPSAPSTQQRPPLHAVASPPGASGLGAAAPPLLRSPSSIAASLVRAAAPWTSAPSPAGMAGAAGAGAPLPKRASPAAAAGAGDNPLLQRTLPFKRGLDGNPVAGSPRGGEL